MPTHQTENTRLPTGVPGLDTLLRGGFHRGRLYLVNGEPGTGKTTLGLQFLLEGAKAGERTMLLSLIESRVELEAVARSHGWSLDDIEILELPREVKQTAAAVQTVFTPGEVEFGAMTETLIEGVRRYRPDRLVLDSISQLSMLSGSWYELRGPILEIKSMVQALGCTTLLTSSGARGDLAELETIVHSSITLRSQPPAYGQVRRELLVNKMRGGDFVTGYHNFRIRTGGIEIFTWPEASPEPRSQPWQVIRSDIDALDALLGGGLEAGTACLLSGSTGTGKSTLATLYLLSAARQGERSIVFCFDERRDTFLQRSDSLGLDVRRYMDQGLITLQQIDVGEMSPGEFAHRVRHTVEEMAARVVVIDSLSGYLNAMPDDRLLSVQLHELLNYLASRDVLTLMIETYHSDGNIYFTGVDASYIADTVVTLRHFEAMGHMRRCLAVVKKRHGEHEKSIREFSIAYGGCRVGPPIDDFTGILTGNPTFVGDKKSLFVLDRKESGYGDEG